MTWCRASVSPNKNLCLASPFFTLRNSVNIGLAVPTKSPTFPSSQFRLPDPSMPCCNRNSFSSRPPVILSSSILHTVFFNRCIPSDPSFIGIPMLPDTLSPEYTVRSNHWRERSSWSPAAAKTSAIEQTSHILGRKYDAISPSRPSIVCTKYLLRKSSPATLAQSAVRATHAGNNALPHSSGPSSSCDWSNVL